jgi:hypothetical protein
MTEVASPSSPDAPQPLTPGWRTSEAWFTFLTMALGAIPSSGLTADAPLLAKVVGQALAAVAAIHYVAQRSALKRAHLAHRGHVAKAPAPVVIPTVAAAAVVLLLGIGLTSCGGVDCKDPKSAQSAQCVIEGAVVDCTGVSSLSSTIAVVQPLVEGLLASALQPDGSIAWSSIESQLVDLALQYGTCVLAEIWNSYMHGTLPGGSAAGSGSKLARAHLVPDDFAREFDRIRARVAPGRKFKTSGATL